MSTTERPITSLRALDRLFIDGDWVVPTTATTFEVIEASTEQLLYEVAAAAPADVDRAVAAARLAFDRGPWPRMTHAERAVHLRALAAGLEARREELAQLWSSEMGIVHSLAQLYIGGVSATYEFYAGLADDFEFVERHQPTAGGNVGLLAREPVGTVGIIVPWNAPAAAIAYKAAPALLAGCTIVVKVAPEAPGSGYLLAEVAEAAGLPPGVINVITADREVSELLVRDERIDKVAFTGSTAAGRRIASICGERIARYTLELGGKSAAVVLDDADLAAVAESLSQSARLMTGQICSSITRIVVGRKRHDAFVDALCASFSGVRVGDPFDALTEMGPLAGRRQRDRVEQLIAAGEREGATLATGGRRPARLDRGFFVAPTVFADVDNASTIAREEIFGPVLSVIPADSEEHAVDIANDTIYGLNASVFTPDVDRAYAVARRLRSGTVGHNAFHTDFGIAFGGFKQSGIGREGGREGLLPYLEAKTIILDREPTADTPTR